MAAVPTVEYEYWISSDEDREIYDIVSGPACSLPLIERLAEEHEIFPMMIAARNPECPLDVIEYLAKSPFLFVREAVALSPVISEMIQAEIVKDPEPSVVAALISNPTAMARFDAASWKKFAKSKSAEVRAAVAASEGAPEEILGMLANDKAQSVRMSAAGNPRTPEVEITNKTPNERAIEEIYTVDTLEGLDKFLDTETYSGSVATVAVARALELGLITSKDARKRLSDEYTTAGVELWLNHKGESIQNISDETIDILISMGADRFLSRGLANRMKCTPAQIVKIAGSKQPQAVWGILHYCALTPEILEAASTSPSFSYKEYGGYGYPKPLPLGVVFTEDKWGAAFVTSHPQVIVASHPLTPQPVVGKLKKARSKYVRAAVLARPETDEEELRESATNPEAAIRAAVAGHPNTPKDTLYALAGDEDPEVQLKVKENPSAPDEALTLIHLSGV